MQAVTNDLPEASSRGCDKKSEESNNDCSTLSIEGQGCTTEWIVCSIDPKPEVDVCCAISYGEQENAEAISESLTYLVV